MRSVWLCSRNDAIGNIAMMGAAAAIWLMQRSGGGGDHGRIVSVVISAILRQGLREYRTGESMTANGNMSVAG